MNTNGNLYTFTYSTVMVIIVAAALAFASYKLQPAQDKNVRVEKMQDILSSVGIASEFVNAEGKFNKHIIKQLAVDSKGSEVSGVKPFEINLKVEYKKPLDKRVLPVYMAELDDGSQKLILPLLGKGLWGPVWGYISFNEDHNTVYGAVFDHKSETPGLGAEINTDWFENEFKGKTVFDESGEFVSVILYKGGTGAAAAAGDTKHGVDAISGGTITSKGVEAMLKECLGSYQNYLKLSSALKE
jgi:Na+-transporting NADH:ubiquinone oxidoreductase subunit C